ncbi:MAG TPA: cbb3-type cytochrome c oxidase subunit I [Acidimicrobiales bacterium]|nr:cbb3-type cytochrome c oxidase subunit I [Acidimicrobiales bacterium]
MSDVRTDSGARTESIFVTADHKRLGRAQAILALVLLAVAGAGSLAVMAQAAGGEVQKFESLWSLHDAFAGVFVVLPLWLGLAAVVVPLQIGTTRLAFPLLQSLTLWTLIGGAVLVLAGYAMTPAPFADRSVFSSIPVPAVLEGDTRGADLMTMGMLLGALATLAAALNLVTTIATRRAPGLTLGRLPYFSWSVLVGGVAVLLATPVFVAGLLVVWMDQHFGGSVFETEGMEFLWTHAVWLGGRPEAFLGLVFALGAGSDIVATATRRGLVADKPARAGIAAVATLSFVAWAGGPDAVDSVLAPFVDPVSLLPALAAGAVVLTWLLNFRHGARTHAALIPIVAALSLGVVAALNAALRAASEVEVGTGWGRASLTLVAVAIPVTAAVGAAVHWAPKVAGRRLSMGAGAVTGLALAGGFALLQASAALLGADGAPRYSAAGFAEDSHQQLALLGAVGVVLIAFAVLRLLAAVAMPTREGLGADPYGTGLTLEWLTASPPARHNFDAVPEVRSATPLVDARSGGST